MKENEFEGVELAEYRIARELKRKEQKRCRHRKMRFETYTRYTQDARKQVVMDGKCPDCGLFERKILREQDVSEEARLR